MIGLLVGALPVPAAQHDQVFGSWRTSCSVRTSGGESDCYLYQSIFLKKKYKQILRIAVGEFQQREQLSIAFTLPLGAAVGVGGMMQVDQNQPIRFDLQFCTAKSGCSGVLPLDYQTLNLLDVGHIVHVIFYDHNQQPVTISVSLNGFSEGLRALFVE